MQNYNYNIRVTGILIEDGKLLLVKQKISDTRQWSLPGGRAENGETLDKAIVREFYEETGLKIHCDKMLYVCHVKNTSPPIIHITFSVSKMSGNITLPTNEYDENPIYDVKFVEIENLEEYGFSKKFIEIVENNFHDSGSFFRDKAMIGL